MLNAIIRNYDPVRSFEFSFYSFSLAYDEWTPQIALGAAVILLCIRREPFPFQYALGRAKVFGLVSSIKIQHDFPFLLSKKRSKVVKYSPRLRKKNSKSLMCADGFINEFLPLLWDHSECEKFSSLFSTLRNHKLHQTIMKFLNF